MKYNKNIVKFGETALQLKLLNFYRLLANFATTLVGAFVPLLVYKYTNNLFLAFVPLIAQNLLNLVFNFAFKKFLHKYPQLCLLLRIIPLVIYEIFIIFIDKNLILALVGISVFAALNTTLESVPSEIIFNYSQTKNTSSKSLGISQFFSQLGLILSSIIGGLFLDFINQIFLVIVSLGLYLIACIPLLIFYFKNKRDKFFNQESVSNAYIYLEHKDNSNKGKKVSVSFKLKYTVVYLLICVLDAGYVLISMYAFINSGTFALAGLMCGLFDGFYGVGCYIVGKLDEKIDIKPYATVSCIVISILWGIMPFLGNVLAMYIIFVVIGAIYPIVTIFLQSRMLAKSQILGISNDCQSIRINTAILSPSIIFLLSPFGFLTMFICAGVVGVVGSFSMHVNEEKTRKQIVNYLQQNELK